MRFFFRSKYFSTRAKPPQFLLQLSFLAAGALCGGGTTDLAFSSISYLYWPSNFTVH